MNIYRGISEAILKLAVDRHNLGFWYYELTEEQKEDILLGLDKKLNVLVGEHRDELDQFAATAVVLGRTTNDNVKESVVNKEKPSNRCKAVPKHKAKEGKPVMGVRIINNTDLSDDEVKEIGCELVDRFSNLLGM